MRKDHRPWAIKRAFIKLEKHYTRHFIAPQLTRLGRGDRFMRPWHVKLFGAPIEIGRCATVIAASDAKVRLSVWPQAVGQGRIAIGDYGLLCPGVRVSSACAVTIGNNCMLANGVYVTDSDWHDIYNRLAMGRAEAVSVGDNVWIGDGATVCKGVQIGENSIIGAGSVVVREIPANSVAAGNPARVVKTLDTTNAFVTRQSWFDQAHNLADEFKAWDQALLNGNSLLGWLRASLFPTRDD
ncbi:MAG: acyltransferase [Desulfosarcinaceae bacterium]|nr:acyltransferase [Desulfosarcinaceae bacterium]